MVDDITATNQPINQPPFLAQRPCRRVAATMSAPAGEGAESKRGGGDGATDGGAAAAGDARRVVLEGVLDKAGQKFPYTWKTRHFELGGDGVLRYFTKG